jgi:hypothetical protein
LNPQGTTYATANAYYATENTNTSPRDAVATYAAIQTKILIKGDGSVANSNWVDSININSLSQVTYKFHTTNAQPTDYSGVNDTVYLFKNKTAGAFAGTTWGGTLSDYHFFTSPQIAYKAAYIAHNNPLPATFNAASGTDSWTNLWNSGNPTFSKADLLYREHKDAAGNVTAPPDGYLVPYFQGLCYYRLNIGEGSPLAAYVKRNHLYKANITKFTNIGVPNIDDLDDTPEKPIGEQTFVTATITVAPWQEVETGQEI